ncbi:hypothetical protein ACJX0J_032877 [Zea mays]
MKEHHVFMKDMQGAREVNAPMIFDASNYLNPTNLGIMLTRTTIYAQPTFIHLFPQMHRKRIPGCKDVIFASGYSCAIFLKLIIFIFSGDYNNFSFLATCKAINMLN